MLPAGYSFSLSFLSLFSFLSSSEPELELEIDSVISFSEKMQAEDTAKLDGGLFS
jgi:hypothetical protein